MSRRSAPDSPWQNGVPPFGLGQQFSPMMNVSPVWGQANLPFMGGGNMMSPDMMRFGGNVSSRSNFRRYYDQVSCILGLVVCPVWRGGTPPALS